MTRERDKLVHEIEQLLQSRDSSVLRAFLEDIRNSDIAEVVELMDNDDRRLIFDALDKPTSAEVLEKVDEATRSELFELLEDHEIAGIVSELSHDDAADVLAEMDTVESNGVLGSLSPDEARQIKNLMRYSEDSAGGIMDTVLISVYEDATVAEAVEKIRAAEIDEDFFSVFVVDRNNKFVGDTRIRLLLTSNENKKISELLDPDTIYVSVGADQEEVRNLFRKNDLIVAPVLDTQHRLIGRITADRIIEVAEEEANEDIYAIAGTNDSELESESIFRAARIRMTWLLPCLVGTAITAMVGMFFREAFFRNGELYIWAIAFVFVPMIAAISGNAGLQTSAIVVSGLAAGHLADLRLRDVFAREVRIAVLVAICCGLIGAAICAFLPNASDPSAIPQGIKIITLAEHLKIVFAFGTGMFSAIMVATTLGLFLPFLFRRIGIDPAISAGPLVTTANDSISVGIYMTLTLLLI